MEMEIDGPSTNPTGGHPSPAAPPSVNVVRCPQCHPPGFRFAATDVELITEFLNKRIQGERLPYLDKIKDINLYQYNPEQLAEMLINLDNKWYCFTPRDRKYLDRAAGRGYWKATGSNQKITVGERIIGYKNSFVFYQGKPRKEGLKTNWIMDEFTTPDEPSKEPNRSWANQSGKLDDFDLCRIQQNNINDNDDVQVNANILSSRIQSCCILHGI